MDKIAGQAAYPMQTSDAADEKDLEVAINTRKANVNRQLRKANPGSGPDPKRKIIISLVPIEQFSSNFQDL